MKLRGRVSPRLVARLYVKDGLSRDRIASQLGIPHSAVCEALKNQRVLMRPKITPTTVTELTIFNPKPDRIVSFGRSAKVKRQIRLTMEFAYLLGWTLGDGYTNKREMDAIISLRERKYVELFLKHELREYGRLLVVTRHGTHIVRCLSTRLARVLCTPGGRRFWRNVDFVLRFPKYAAALMAGFWDADGGVFHDTNGAFRVHLYNSNRGLLERIAKALTTHFGIETAIYKRKRTHSPNSNIHQKKARLDLYVWANSNELWARNISTFMKLPWKKP